MHLSLYRQVLQQRQDLYNFAIDHAVHRPFVYPWDTLPILFLIVGIAFTPRLSKPLAILARWLLTIASISCMVLIWQEVRTVGLTSGYGIGLSGFWGLIMTILLLLLHDPGKDFRRVEMREIRTKNELNSHGSTTGRQYPQTGDVRERGQTAKSSGVNGQATTSQVTGHLVWQEKPKDFYHLLDWSIDLITSFRGINWNFRVPIKTHTVQPPEGDPPTLSAEASKLNQGALKRLQRSSIVKFLCYYIVLDLLKTIVVTDPYYLGVASLGSPTPWPWLARLNAIVPGATKFVRLSISMTSVVSALTFIFSLNPLFFATVFPYLVGDKLYSLTKCPLLEVWMYPPQWGNMFETLCNKGLAGMWSTWWHQMFRYGISEPSKLLTAKLGINPRSQLGRVLQLLIAFGLTAGIHASASSTTFSIVQSKPLNPFIFFMSQAVGILVQTELSRRLDKRFHFPKLVRQTGNFFFVLVFMWYIGPFLSDDFARCGIWLFEPLPISFFRGLGFGTADCWVPWLQFAEGGRWIGLYRGKHWYTTGIGIY